MKKKQNMETLNLKELIHTVRQELIDSEKERIDKGLSPLFKVDNLKIEVNFVAEKSKKTGGKIDLKIVGAGHDVTYSSQQVHKILLELKVCEETDVGTAIEKPFVKLPWDSEIGKASIPGSKPGIRPSFTPGSRPGKTFENLARGKGGRSGINK